MSLFKYCLFTLLVLSSISLQGQEIKWMTWEEAAMANEKNPKKIFVDVYTDWCGWCKKMDQTTFKEPAVVEIMNEDFYAVKLNAEQQASIFWRDMEFKWTPGGRGGTNKLASELLDGQMSFPSFVLLDATYARIAISPGYKIGDTLIKELKFASEEYYKTTDWQTYLSKT